MKAQWQILSSKLEALSQRERWMVFAAGLVVIFAVLNALLISPVTKKKPADGRNQSDTIPDFRD